MVFEETPCSDSALKMHNCMKLSLMPSGLTNHAATATVTTPNHQTESDGGGKRSYKLSDTLEEAVDEKQRYIQEGYFSTFAKNTS